jgi:hypothetical protein
MTNVIPLSSTSTRPVPINWVEKLFERMQALYGNKFVDMWRDTNIDLVKQLWAEEMGKLQADDLKRGYAALMSREWPPSLPEFVKLCRPSVDSTVAYYEAVNGMAARERGDKGTWSHPAIFWAAVQVSAFDLKNQPFSQIKTRWEAALQSEMEKGQWAEIPKPMIAIPAPGNTKMDRDTASKRLQELGASDVLKPKNDHLRWEHKIMERKANKDTTLPDISLRFAKEALGIK